MKNRFLFLCLFLFVNLTNNIYANEFTFDVEEINISNNGNIINGTNGTARTIDKSLEIKANRLIYKKDLIWLGEYPNGMTSYHLND